MRQMSITRGLARTFANSDRAWSLASRLRAKRITPLLDMIEAVFRDRGLVDILDIGGTEQYWNIVSKDYLDQHNVRFTIVNLSNTSLQEHGRFSFVAADGCNLEEFKDRSFDIIHSNSVIEHVGDWDRMVAFAKEISRLAPRSYVQTPNYWFPIEPHCMTPFFHWLPKPSRIWLVCHFQLGHWTRAATIDEAVRNVESARLLNKKMLQELFKDSEILTERFCWMAKSFVAIKSLSKRDA
jgi:hypothetical protein